MRILLPISLLTALVASAQVPSFSCSASAAPARDIVVDGLTELVSDLLIRCSGGVPTAARAQIPTATIIVSLNTAITSRLLSSTWTEALLLLDEPGPSSQFACETSSGICGALGDGSGSGKYYGPGPSGTTGNNKNVFQGRLATPNLLTWTGVPIDPPGANGSRTIRINNIRVNASQPGASGPNGAPTIVASLSSTPASVLPIGSPNQVVAVVREGLATSIRNAANTADVSGPLSFSGCASQQVTRIATLRFGERYASAFTRRNIATTPVLTSDLAPQNNLATTYQTQTGFYNPNLSGSTAARGNLGTAGLADSGTRLKAVFRNIPPGVNLFVSTSDASGKARLTATETGDFTFVSLANPSQLIVQNRSATAVWEVLGDDPASIEQFDFGVFVNLSADVVSSGGITVNRTVAPNSSDTSAAAGPVPRFADTSSATSLLTFGGCSAPAPSLDRLNPASATAGGPGFTLGVTGANFVSGAAVQWNGSPLATTFAGVTQLTAAVPASLLAQPGAANITVVNPNGSRSNRVIFPINPSVTPFTLSVPSLTFQFAGGSQAQTQQIQIGSLAGPAVPFTAAASLATPAAASWLRVDPSSGVTPATLTVTVNPAGLKPGVYIGSITISVAASISPKSTGRDAVGDAVVTVTLVISDDRLSFTALAGGPRPSKALTVAALSATNARFTAAAAVSTPAGGTWLSLNPADTNAPTSVTVSADPAGLAAGTYIGVITLSPADSTGSARQVPVTLTVVAAANQTLSFAYQTGAAAPSPQSFTSNVGSGPVNAEAFSDGNWLSVSPSSGNSPATFSCSVSPAGLSAGTYSGTVVITDANSATVYVTRVTLTVASGGPITQIISHIADGARWKTTIILINLDSVPAPYTLNFWRDDGTAFFVSLSGRGTLATVTDTIPAGGSRTLETDGTAGALSTGWAEVISSQAIGGTAVFRDQNLAQEAAVALLSGAGGRALLPFDTGGLSLGVGLANPSQTQDVVVSRTLRNAQGQVITSDTLPLARHGHTAFVLTNPSVRPEDQRGVLELSSSTGQLFSLGIRGNNGAFTSIEALAPQDPKTKVISHVANGARWKTTIVIVNTDSVPAQFTVNFWKDDGSPFTVTLVDGRSLAQVSDTIPVGGSRTIETDGLASVLSTGWAEVLSAQSIGGTAIFRDQTLAQEAAVPLLSSGGTRLLLPFDRGLDLGVALANANPGQDASITRTLRNEQGVTISADSLLVSRRAHTAFGLTNPSARPEDQRGVVEFSSGVEFFSLGIRGNNGAFTSIRALSK